MSSNNRLQDWVDTLSNGGSTTDKLMLFFNAQGLSGGATEMMYEFCKTKSSKASHSERFEEWSDAGFGA